MKTTPIYGLPYIEAGDLVSSAPAQFKTMAEGFENALNEVDSRNTPAGVKPAIATTLETLAGITGVTGQAGYVTADPAEGNNGPYCWTGSAWARGPKATSESSPKDGGRCSTSISASAAATEPTRKPSTSVPTAPWTTPTMVAPKVLPLSAAR